MGKLKHMLQKFAQCGDRFHFLEIDERNINGYRFFGSSLWIDFQFSGTGMNEVAKRKCEEQSSDLYRIRIQLDLRPEKLKTANLIELYNKSVLFLKEKLLENFDGESIIISHHDPNPKSL